MAGKHNLGPSPTGAAPSWAGLAGSAGGRGEGGGAGRHLDRLHALCLVRRYLDPSAADSSGSSGSAYGATSASTSSSGGVERLAAELHLRAGLWAAGARVATLVNGAGEASDLVTRRTHSLSLILTLPSHSRALHLSPALRPPRCRRRDGALQRKPRCILRGRSMGRRSWRQHQHHQHLLQQHQQGRRERRR